MTILRAPDLTIGPFPPGDTATFTATLRDEDGTAIPGSALDRIVYSLIRESRPTEFINDRDGVDLSGQVDANGLLTIPLTTADMAVDVWDQAEFHRLQIAWDWDTDRHGSAEIQVIVGGAVRASAARPYTALDFITKALRLIGVIGEATEPSAEEAANGLDVLNEWVDSLPLRVTGSINVSRFVNLSTAYTFTPGYVRAIRFNLATALALEYPSFPASPEVVAAAALSFADIKRANYRPAVATIDGVICPGGRYHVYTDQWR